MTASFGVLSRVLVQSSPSGLSLQVDGTACTTPCTIDRRWGATARDGSSTVSLGRQRADGIRFLVRQRSFRSYVCGQYGFLGGHSQLPDIVPAQRGVRSREWREFKFDPGSSDMFYPEDTRVTVSANPNPGFKFRRWDGDLTGTYPVGVVMMSSPHGVITRTDKVPFIAPAGVKNAVGDTPNSTVAPGSIIFNIWREPGSRA